MRVYLNDIEVVEVIDEVRPCPVVALFVSSPLVRVEDQAYMTSRASINGGIDLSVHLSIV